MPSTTRKSRPVTAAAPPPSTASTTSVKPLSLERSSSIRSVAEPEVKLEVVQPGNMQSSDERERKRQRREPAASQLATVEEQPVVEVVQVRHAQAKRSRSHSRRNRANNDKLKRKRSAAQLDDVVMEPSAGTSDVVREESLAAMEAELVKLKTQLKEKDTIIDRQHTALSSVHASLQCQICLDLLKRPFVIAKCGHVSCQGCLEAWFSQAPQQDHMHDHDIDDHPLHLRRKTCPHCRETVTRRPAPLYLIKELVGIMAAPSLLDKTSLRDGTIPPEAPNHTAGENPFAQYFPAERPDGLILDEADGGIVRCPDCFHEIFDGACMGCGRIWDGHDANWDFEDGSGDGSESSSDIGSLHDFIEEDDDGIYHRPWFPQGLLDVFRPPRDRGVNFTFDEEHDDPYGLEEDDISVHELHELDLPPRGRSVARAADRLLVLDALAEDDDGDDYSEPIGPITGSARRVYFSDEDEELEEDSDEEEEEEEQTPRGVRRVGRVTVVEDSDDEEDQDVDDTLEESAKSDSGRDTLSTQSDEDEVSGSDEGMAYYDADSAEESSEYYSDEEP